MSDRELWRLDATAQAALIQSGEISSSELVEAAIARIERLNPQINAVITPLYDEAREQAAAMSSATADAPFAGLPMLLKDASIEVEGAPYAIGTKLLRDLGYRSQRTTELARRFRRAGFIFLGKTNVPAMSAGVTTEPAAFGPTRNPWDLDRTPGGSSGGSAAAVAAGMTAIAHGADGTGSLRYPAACCGVVTLKPTRGLVPSDPPAGQPDFNGVWAEFVLARSIRDLAGVLDAVSNGRARRAISYTGGLISPVGALRVGLLTRDVMANIPVDPACVAAVEATGRTLESLGHQAEVAHPPALDGLFVRAFEGPFKSFMDAFAVVGPVARYVQCRTLAEIAGRPLTADDVESENLVPEEQVAGISAVRLADAVATFERETAPIHDWWDDGWDLLVTPTLREPARPLGQRAGAAPSNVFSPPFSYTGQPAMSLPLHHADNGLPVGVQIIAARGRDDLLLAVAAQLEAATPWAHRWPPLAETP